MSNHIPRYNRPGPGASSTISGEITQHWSKCLTLTLYKLLLTCVWSLNLRHLRRPRDWRSKKWFLGSLTAASDASLTPHSVRMTSLNGQMQNVNITGWDFLFISDRDELDDTCGLIESWSLHHLGRHLVIPLKRKNNNNDHKRHGLLAKNTFQLKSFGPWVLVLNLSSGPVGRPTWAVHIFWNKKKKSQYPLSNHVDHGYIYLIESK